MIEPPYPSPPPPLTTNFYYYYYYYYYYYCCCCCCCYFDSEKELWSHQRGVLKEEYPHDMTVGGALFKLVEVEQAVVAGVEDSKAKDDERGGSIIDDYGSTHVVASEDPMVKRCKRQWREYQKKVEELVRLPLAKTQIVDLLP